MKYNLIKKFIVSTFDLTFINYHFKKKYEIEEAKKIAYVRTSFLVSFCILVIFLVISILVTALFKFPIKNNVESRLYVYPIVLSIVFLLYIKNNKIQDYLKKYINFSTEKYSDDFVKLNKKRGLLNATYLGIIFGIGYVVVRLLGWYLSHI